MRRDATFVVDPSDSDDSSVSLGEMIIAIGWTLTVTLFGFALAGLAVIYMI